MKGKNPESSPKQPKEKSEIEAPKRDGKKKDADAKKREEGKEDRPKSQQGKMKTHVASRDANANRPETAKENRCKRRNRARSNLHHRQDSTLRKQPTEEFETAERADGRRGYATGSHLSAHEKARGLNVTKHDDLAMGRVRETSVTSRAGQRRGR